MENSFESACRVTNKTNRDLLPLVEPIYQQFIPGCRREDIRNGDLLRGTLDIDFAIDSRIICPDGSWIAMQEKLREYKEVRYRDFTMEHRNAFGTQYESPGEWFHLGAQLYFYAWADVSRTRFAAWRLFDVAAIKILVACAGGLEKVGRFQKNSAYGKASFYGIPIWKLGPAIVESFGDVADC